MRPDVQTVAFDWERLIPVVPWMIVPYWSLDAFFIAAPFLCTNRQELRVLKKRLLGASLIAGACFLILPLELAWERPLVTEGPFAPWFQAIQAMDAPHNLFPSLHIVLRTVLAIHYLKHSSGWWKIGVRVWFSLIGLSTLFTWQHHLVDVLGGFLLAAVLFHIIPEQAPPSRARVSRRLAFRYLGFSLLLLASCRINPPWTLMLAWPAAALGTVSAAYFGVGGSLLRKKRGRLPTVTQWLLAPWLLGQEVSWWWYRRQSSERDKLTSRVWMGPIPDHVSAYELIDAGVTDVLDMTAEFEAPEAFRRLEGYRNLPVADLTAPTLEQMQEAAAIIERARHNGVIFVHCKAGYSRTAAAVGAWLLQNGGTTEAVIKQLKEARPGMIIRPEVVEAFRELEKKLSAPGRKSG